MAKLAVFGCLEKYLFTLFCFEQRKAQKSHCEMLNSIFGPFLDDLVEKKQKEVTIHDLDPLALTLLVDFSYTGEIVITEDNVQVSVNN